MMARYTMRPPEPLDVCLADMPEDTTRRGGLRRWVPASVRAEARRVVGRKPKPAVGEAGPRRLGPNEPGGIARLHVGCGPTNLMAEWWNVDIRSFKGVDEVADVTIPWPWRDLDYVYGEHFLEHLSPDQAAAFLSEARAALRPGGRVRLSTPGLEWVWQTHLDPNGSAESVVADTYRANRAFHGWGHQFLYSRPFLEHLLTSLGLTDIRFFAYGESDDPNLRGLERHGTPETVAGWPSVWNVEATPSARYANEGSARIAVEIDEEFVRYVRSGH